MALGIIIRVFIALPVVQIVLTDKGNYENFGEWSSREGATGAGSATHQDRATQKVSESMWHVSF